MSSAGQKSRVERTVRVKNPQGLHARPSSLLAETALRFDGTEIHLHRGDLAVSAKSIMELLLLEAACGTELRLVCVGEKAEDAAAAIERLFDQQFHVRY